MNTDDSRYHKTYPVSWSQFHNDCRALAWRLLEIRERWARIVAIARGGLVPAAIIARELDIHFIDTVCISSYTVRSRGSAKILKSSIGDSEDCLIIDDLVDTGKTARIVREMLPKSHFATVYAKPDGRPLTDTYVTEVSQETWILFPWDSEPQYQYIDPIADISKSLNG
ncbi:MAG: xanthine phosphoribosyltransferase [Thermovirgaceae bacterium]|nr:xanthine phosphoribosyltransferase [Thermovirgaceae bacterium]